MGMVDLFPNCRFVGRFCFIGNDIRTYGADDIHAAHGRYSAAVRLNDILTCGQDITKNPGNPTRRGRIAGAGEKL